MAKIVIDQTRCVLCGACENACPFGAITAAGTVVSIGENCVFCSACREVCPAGAIRILEQKNDTAAVPQEKGILVYGQLAGGRLLGAAREMVGAAQRLALPGEGISLVCMGEIDQENLLKEAADLGIEKIYLAAGEAFACFREDLYAAALVTAAKAENPSVILLGGTPEGRAIAPRAAAALCTGLTADCTALGRKEDGGLVQTRPAFGGNLMAEIITWTRPQMATVRPGVMEKEAKQGKGKPKLISLKIEETSKIKVIRVWERKQKEDIGEEKVLVAVGNGIKNKKDLGLFEEFARMLGGQLASSRPLVEKGWMPGEKQIGLSGKNVSPDLLVTLGISGSVQFLAGIGRPKRWIAINKDPGAAVAAHAHTFLLGDIYEWIPKTMEELAKRGGKR